MHASYVVIGGGLSGLAAAIRLARFKDDVLLVEKHSRVGGLNSYYYRNNNLLETGLHAITNFADKSNRHAPFNKLLRQLKIKREEIGCHQQLGSEIRFPDTKICFGNDFCLLQDEIHDNFPGESQGFSELVNYLDSINPFELGPFSSARSRLAFYIKDPLLVDMLLCPIMYYGSSWENDIDFNQFTILFRSVYQEGLFRPSGTIKSLLDLLVEKFNYYGGQIKLQTDVKRIISNGKTASAIELSNGDQITCDHLVSSVGLDETNKLLGIPSQPEKRKRLSFFETIFLVRKGIAQKLPSDKTCIFYSNSPSFQFRRPDGPVDFSNGAITLPFNFEDLELHSESFEIRTTHLANYPLWLETGASQENYRLAKEKVVSITCRQAEEIIGRFADDIVFSDCFSPLTIEKFTGKIQGAVYGSPKKMGDGSIGYDNLFLTGTDQGFLGIVGSLMSGVAMVNKHILTKT